MTVFRLPFPYIQGTPGSGLGNPEEFADAIQSNLDALAASLGPVAQTQPTRVTTLPASPFDGQEIYFLADATNGVVWHLKYRAASGSSYKWEFVGGATLRAAVDTSETTTSVSFTNLSTVGPSLTLPLAGDYDIVWGARTYGNTAGVSYKVGPSLASGGVGDYIDNFAAAVSGGASEGVNVIGDKRKTGRSAGDTVVLKYASNGTAVGTWDSRWVRAVPVRVG